VMLQIPHTVFEGGSSWGLTWGNLLNLIPSLPCSTILEVCTSPGLLKNRTTFRVGPTVVTVVSASQIGEIFEVPNDSLV
jgi:hypothetical protein